MKMNPNGTWSPIFSPDNYQEEPPVVIGYTLSGRPLRQGYLALTFLWSYINQEDFTALMNVWHAVNGPVQFSYIDKLDGQEKILKGRMHEPLVGMRQFVYYANVAVRFTHCELP